MRVLLAGATGAIGRPLISGLTQRGHGVFGLVRSAKSTHILTEVGAEALIGDALDAASVRAVVARVRQAKRCGACRGSAARRHYGRAHDIHAGRQAVHRGGDRWKRARSRVGGLGAAVIGTSTLKTRASSRRMVRLAY